MTEIDSNRIIAVKGGFNFRDLGGLPTRDGTRVKKNIFFRTDELGNLQDADLELLQTLQVRTIVDFRTEQERYKLVNKIPATCMKEIHLDIISGNMNTYLAQIQSGKADFEQLMLSLYRDLVVGENGITQFRKFFEIVQQKENTPMIIHCTAGKDRTGIAAALILSALNVDIQDIVEDYLLSNIFLQKKYESYIANDPKLETLFTVKSSYLQYAINTIVEQYGSIKQYLEEVLNVDVALLRAYYTA